MTIEDGLEGLPEGEKTAESKTEGTINDLVTDGNKIMGKALLDYFRGQLPGQRSGSGLRIPDKVCSVIQKTGMSLFTFSPLKAGQLNYLRCDITDELTDDTVREVVKCLCGDYALETDVIKIATRDRFGELAERIPEIGYLRDVVCSDDLDSVAKRTTLHPYIIVMGMPLEHRPLAGIVVENALNRGLKLLSEIFKPGWSEHTIEGFIRSMMPDTAIYFEIAKQYGVKEVLPIIKAYQAACQEYREKWYV